MLDRRRFLGLGSLGLGAFSFSGFRTAPDTRKPIVISTWNEGIHANKAAWNVLGKGGRALDAVEQGVMVTEASQNCCVGLGANPDRDGYVTLDACIMDELGNCGSVAAIEHIAHPISVARLVMEKTPHVFASRQAAEKISVSSPGIVAAVSIISSWSYIMPIVLYSGKITRSIPGNPSFIPLITSEM